MYNLVWILSQAPAHGRHGPAKKQLSSYRYATQQDIYLPFYQWHRQFPLVSRWCDQLFLDGTFN